jgi:hypothetical protein
VGITRKGSFTFVVAR